MDDNFTDPPAEKYLTASSLLSGKSAAEWRALYANAYDWGPDVGLQIITYEDSHSIARPDVISDPQA